MNLIGNIILWVVYFISLYFSIFLVLVYFDNRDKIKSESSSLIPKKIPVVSILIPAYNEEKTIIGTMESVMNINYPKNKLDVIVINDGSSDGTGIQAEKFIEEHNLSHFKLISHDNIGKANSMNKALKLAKGEFFTWLDADSFVEPDTLRKMLSFFYNQDDPQLAIVTPAMKVFKPKNVLQKIQWIEYLVMIFVGRLSSHLDSLYVAPGPFSMYRTDIIRKVGGFDNSTLTEDQEIAYRMQKYNYRIKQCFDAYVYTVSPHELVPFYKQRRRWYLGSISCAYKYKNMIANKKYGDFGIIQMIKNVIGYFLALVGIGFAGYFLLYPFVLKIKNIWMINFDFLTLFKDYTLLFDPLFLDIPKVIVFGALFLTSAFFFYKAHQNAKENVNAIGYLPIVPYFAFYYLLKGMILIVSLYEFGRGKKIKW